jgi:hypothetical protein
MDTTHGYAQIEHIPPVTHVHQPDVETPVQEPTVQAPVFQESIERSFADTLTEDKISPPPSSLPTTETHPKVDNLEQRHDEPDHTVKQETWSAPYVEWDATR